MSRNIQQNRWKPQNGELAERIDIRNDVAGRFFKDLNIEVWQKLLLSADGRLNEESGGLYDSGNYTVDTFGDLLARKIGLRNANRWQAIFFSLKPFTLTFRYDNLFTIDPYQTSMTLRVMLKIKDVKQFVGGMMREKRVVTEADLTNELWADIRGVAAAWVGRRSLEQLARTDARLELGEKINLAIDDTVEQGSLVERFGLEIIQLRSYDYALVQLNRINQKREEYLIKRSEEDVRLTGEEELFERIKRGEELDLKRASREVEIFGRKAAVRESMRRAVNSDRFNEVKSEQGMTVFLRKIDKENLIADDEWRRFQRTIQWQEDDELRQRKWRLEDVEHKRSLTLSVQDRTRAQVLARIDLESAFDLDMLRLTRDSELQPAQLELEQKLARQRVEGKHVLDVIALEADLEKQKRRKDFEREQAAADAAAARVELLEKMRVDGLQRAAEVDEDKQDLELAREGWDVVIYMKRTKADLARANKELDLALDRVHRKEMLIIQYDEDMRRTKMRLEEKRFEFDMQIRISQEKTRSEVELRTASRGMTLDEGLIAMGAASDLLAAKQLDVDAKKVEGDLFKGQSAEMILAQLDPEAASKVLTEQARQQGLSSAEKDSLIERLLAERETRVRESQDRTETVRQDQHRRDDSEERADQREDQRKLRETELRGEAEVKRAESSGNAPPASTNIIMPSAGGMGGAQIVGGSVSNIGGQTLICPNCAHVNKPTANHCENCGYKLRGNG